jgi:uncharacterized protein (TIRG00374 family)
MVKTNIRARLVSAVKIIVFAIACALLVQVIRSADWARVTSILRSSGPKIILGALPYLFAISVDTLGWQVLLRSLRRHVSFHQLLQLRFATEAVLLSLPMGPVAAESLKAYLLEKRAGVPAPEGVSSIAAKKNLLMISLAAFLVTSVFFGYPYLADASYSILGTGGLPLLILGGASALVFASMVMSVLLLHGAMAERIHRILVAIPVRSVRNWLLRRSERFREVDASFAPIARDRGRLVTVGVLFYIGFLIEAIESYVILRLIGADISFVQVLAFDASVSLIRSAAVFVPAGLGFQDMGYLAFFHAFAIPDASNVGAAFVLVKRAKEVLWILFGYGMLGLMRHRAARPQPVRRDAKPRVLFICGSRNQTTQMHAIARRLEGEIDPTFTPYYVDGILRLWRWLRFIEVSIAGHKMTARCMEYLREHGLPIDHGGKTGPYDLVVTCQDAVMPRNILSSKVILVQEGMTDPEGLMFWLWRRVPWLVPRWFTSTAATGMSDLYDRFCVASPGYRDFFVHKKGVRADKVVVTGIPNFDNCQKYLLNDFPHRGYVLVCTSDMRETFRFENRRKFLERCADIAAGRQLVFKLHPNEKLDRATREIREVSATALVYQTGSAEEMIANCDVLVTQYSSVSYVGLALGKEVHSYFDVDELKQLLPLQHGRAAENIGDVCRALLRDQATRPLPATEPQALLSA